jgi:hypothetical protein
MKLKDENQMGKITGQQWVHFCVYSSFIEVFTVFFNSNFLLVFLKKCYWWRVGDCLFGIYHISVLFIISHKNRQNILLTNIINETKRWKSDEISTGQHSPDLGQTHAMWRGYISYKSTQPSSWLQTSDRK